MTRKRFKKLCMSLGFERDRAEGFCWLACALTESYAAAWSAICLGLEARAAEGVGSAVSGAGVGPYREEAAKCE